MNASLCNAVQHLSCALQEKEEANLDMQDMYEGKMLDMLQMKLSNTAASCPCQGFSSSAPDQRQEESEAGEARSNSPKIWCKIKSGMSCCGRSVLSKIKTKASLRSIPKVVTSYNTSEVDNTSSLTS